MTVQPIEYNSSREHRKSWGILWLPDGDTPIKGMVQICHGMCEYTERYAHFAGWLCEQGYAVCGNDHIGHKNTALLSSQRLGYFGGVGSWPYLIEDVELLRKHLAPRFPNTPWILLGHSMGSFIARLYAEKYAKHLSGLILSGTGGKNHMLAVGKAMARSSVAFKGPMHVSKAVDSMVNGTFNKHIKDAHGSSDWLSKDTDLVNKYAQDIYCNFKFTASAYHDLFTMMERCNRREWFASIPKELPILIFSGDEDPVGDYGKGPTQVANRLRGAWVKKVELHLYPGGRHEMINETNRAEVYEDIRKWIESIPNK
ncbi:MAG: alpha/beta fold hydrolase [Angelakisella sp.]